MSTSLTKSTQGYAFNVFRIGDIVLTPTPKTIPNAFDYMGMSIGLPRLPGEKNANYRLRLMDVYVRRAGAHQQGLLNGITRELGLEQYDAMTIAPGSNCPAPRIMIGDTFITLQADNNNPNLCWTWDIYNRNSGYYYLDELIAAINASGYFTATLASGVEGHTRSTCLIIQDSQQRVESEDLPLHHRIKLLNDDIVKDSIHFARAGNVYDMLQLTEAAVTQDGDFYLDYDNGLLVSYTLPPAGAFCSYMYRDFPMTVKASPVMLFELISGTYQQKIFEQILMSDGTTSSGLPNSEATEYINELLSAKGMLWGV